MTFLEVILLIQQRGEKTLTHESRFLITETRRYIRDFDGGESPWREDLEPGKPEKMYGRGGEYYVWKRDEDSST